MVFGPETFRSLVVVPVGEPPSVGRGREYPGFLDVRFDEELLVVLRGFLAFEQPAPAVQSRLATMTRRRMRRMKAFRFEDRIHTVTGLLAATHLPDWNSVTLRGTAGNRAVPHPAGHGVHSFGVPTLLFTRNANVAQRAPASAPRFVAISPDDGKAIDLRNPAAAAFLSWLVPGLGQLYQGRRFKGTAFMLSLMGAFVAGMWIGGGNVVYASWRPGEKRLEFFGQAGIGAAAIPSLVQASFVAGPWHQPLGSAGWFAPPLLRGQLVSETYRQQVIDRDPEIGPGDFDGLRFALRQPGDQLSLWRRRLGRFFDLGTLYTTIAGLLNLLVIYDAWSGPMRYPSTEDDTEKSGTGGEKPGG
jgi:hypothetical protein